MNLTLSPQIRIVALVGLLAIVALGASVTMLGKPHPSTVPPAGERHGSATPRRHTAPVPATAKPGAAAPTHKTTAPRAATPKANAPAAPRGFHGNPVYANLPAPLQWALAHHTVVVVSLYNPHADVDAISVAEAHAGAQDAGAGFLLVSVLDDKVSGILTALLPGGGLLPDPGVLVYRAPGTISVRLDGFADRQSVAQAATNALAASSVAP